MAGANVIGVEVINPAEGEFRLLEYSKEKGVVKGLKVNFNKDFLSIKHSEMMGYLKAEDIASREVVFILPEVSNQSCLISFENIPKRSLKKVVNDYIQNNSDYFGSSKENTVEWCCLGTQKEVSYCAISAVSNEYLYKAYEIFKGIKLSYVLPTLTAYSLLDFRDSQEPEKGERAILNVREDKITLNIYLTGILVWSQATNCRKSDFAEGIPDNIVEMLKRWLNIVRGKGLYPADLVISDAITEEKTEQNTEEILSNALGVKVYKKIYKQNGCDIDIELTTLIGVVRGVIENGKHY